MLRAQRRTSLTAKISWHVSVFYVASNLVLKDILSFRYNNCSMHFCLVVYFPLSHDTTRYSYAVFTLELFTAVAKFINLGKIFVSVNDS